MLKQRRNLSKSFGYGCWNFSVVLVCDIHTLVNFINMPFEFFAERKHRLGVDLFLNGSLLNSIAIGFLLLFVTFFEFVNLSNYFLMGLFIKWRHSGPM